MKKRKPIIILAAVIVCAIIGVAIARGHGESQIRTFTEADAAQVIELRQNDTFAVVLDANPTTGFSWHFTIDNEAVISLRSEEFIEPNSKKPTVGAPGRHYYEFTTAEKGTATIKFEYYRAWEKNNIAETYVFTFHVD
jgi:inhibitor of cysteine peptidase